MTSTELDAWRTQLRKGAAELAVLACLDEKERYGVELLERIRDAGGLDLSEGSIYPLLARLMKERKITGRWVADEGAPHPRKYYALTGDGRAFLAAMLDEWHRFDAAMWQIIGAGARQ